MPGFIPDANELGKIEKAINMLEKMHPDSFRLGWKLENLHDRFDDSPLVGDGNPWEAGTWDTPGEPKLKERLDPPKFDHFFDGSFF